MKLNPVSALEDFKAMLPDVQAFNRLTNRDYRSPQEESMFLTQCRMYIQRAFGEGSRLDKELTKIEIATRSSGPGVIAEKLQPFIEKIVIRDLESEISLKQNELSILKNQNDQLQERISHLLDQIRTRTATEVNLRTDLGKSVAKLNETQSRLMLDAQNIVIHNSKYKILFHVCLLVLITVALLLSPPAFDRPYHWKNIVLIEIGAVIGLVISYLRELPAHWTAIIGVILALIGSIDF